MASDQGGQVLLYSYWRSSSAYRVRIALNLKGIDYEQKFVHLVKDGGEQNTPGYREVNPLGLVPALVHGGRVVTQSLAILEYLDEKFPANPLLPASTPLRALARSMAMTIAADIHPLNNLRVQQYLKGRLRVSSEDSVTWMNHWVSLGFQALEVQLSTSPDTGWCCIGDEPGLVDCLLVPQVYNAERFNCDMSPFPWIRKIVAHCRALPAFQAAEPSAQPDAVAH